MWVFLDPRGFGNEFNSQGDREPFQFNLPNRGEVFPGEARELVEVIPDGTLRTRLRQLEDAIWERWQEYLPDNLEGKMGMAIDSAGAGSRPLVVVAMEELHLAVKALEECVTELEGRLAPIRVVSINKAGVDNGPDQPVCGCPLAGEIFDCARTSQWLSVRLRQLVDSIQI